MYYPSKEKVNATRAGWGSGDKSCKEWKQSLAALSHASITWPRQMAKEPSVALISASERDAKYGVKASKHFPLQVSLGKLDELLENDML